MKKKILIVSLCSVLLICSGCKKDVKLKDGKEVIASLKGKDFTAEELFDELKESYGTNSLVAMVDDYIVSKELNDDDNDKAKDYANAQIKAMKEQYEAAGYDWNEVLSQYGYADEKKLVNDYTNDYKKEVVVKKYLKENATDKEINEYYEKEIYGNYTVKHILIKPDTNDDMSDKEKEEAEEKAKKQAQDIIKKLDDGEDWTKLVKKYSDDEGSKNDEGLIKDFTKGDVVDEFFEATLELKNKEYTKDPVESTYGYHVILKVSNTKKPSLKKSKEKILTAIAQNKLDNDEKLYDNTWVEIRKSYKLDIADSTIKSGYNRKTSQ